MLSNYSILKRNKSKFSSYENIYKKIFIFLIIKILSKFNISSKFLFYFQLTLKFNILLNLKFNRILTRYFWRKQQTNNDKLP